MVMRCTRLCETSLERCLPAPGAQRSQLLEVKVTTRAECSVSVRISVPQSQSTWNVEDGKKRHQDIDDFICWFGQFHFRVDTYVWV